MCARARVCRNFFNFDISISLLFLNIEIGKIRKKGRKGKERVEGWMGSGHIKGNTTRRNNTNFFFFWKKRKIDGLATGLAGPIEVKTSGYLFFFFFLEIRDKLERPEDRLVFFYNTYSLHVSRKLDARSSGELFSIEDLGKKKKSRLAIVPSYLEIEFRHFRQFPVERIDNEARGYQSVMSRSVSQLNL